jgi:hypothetical protein
MGKRDKKQIKVRRSWGDLNPETRVHKDKSKYERAQSKKEIQAALDAELSDDADNFDEDDLTI